jgi:hypothetical protein
MNIISKVILSIMSKTIFALIMGTTVILIVSTAFMQNYYIPRKGYSREKHFHPEGYYFHLNLKERTYDTVYIYNLNRMQYKKDGINN